MTHSPSFSHHIKIKLEQFRAALSRFQHGALVIASGHAQAIFRDDYHHNFVVNPYFKEWLPLSNVAHCYLLIEAQGKPKLFFYKPADIWHKVESLPQQFWLDEFDVIEYSDRTVLPQLLRLELSNAAYIGPESDASYAGLETVAINPDQLLAWVDYQRAYKSHYEIDCIAQANKIAAIAHTAAKTAFMAGASEYDINQAYLQAVSAREQSLPYGNIIAINENSAILHYTHLEAKAPDSSRSFLIDAGFSYNGYSADISRTYCRDDSVNGQLFQCLIDQLDQAQQQLVASAVPGCDYLDLHRQMHQLVAAILHRLDIIYVPAEEAVSKGLSSVFLPHGLGHLLGLQVHDRGGWFADDRGTENPPPAEHPYLRLTRPLAEGMVFTIEPGIYFIPALLQPLRNSENGQLINWDKVDALMPYGGVRIEDDVAIVNGVVRNLTREVLP